MAALAAASGIFDETGYFKDARKNRIYTITVAVDTDPIAIQRYGSKKMNTKGQLTAVYFYLDAKDNPGARITTARSVFQANSILDAAAQYDYIYMRYINGADEFADCNRTPEADLC